LANVKNYIGWHSNNEKSLGKKPFIASLSIGADREMIFKYKQIKIVHKIILELINNER
jgi:alkylated DNA repair dioxygenase AlkB